MNIRPSAAIRQNYNEIAELFIEIDFQKQKCAEDSSLQKTGRILGGFRLSCWLFFGCVFFLCKKHLYIFLSFVKWWKWRTK